MIRAAILTISDTCSKGGREDVSGRTIAEMLAEDTFEICQREIVADDFKTIADALKRFSDEAGVDVVLTTGGTGLGPRDVTPEATASVCERMVPGLGELMRAEGLKKTRNAVLSRGTAGVRGKTLVVNLPGSPKAVKESLEIILGVLPHAVKMMLGGGH
ncbi:MAG: molybdenum cofactor biosynthesis protein [Planctomycetes bacterium B3_Pla]|nr:MAG: molybdenum cofactor biosynthesis protein [Planctomycetes bacterium B3_Pla]